MTLRTRGLNLGGLRGFVKERFHDAGWKQILARLPAEDVAEVWDTLILPTGWYSYAIQARFLDAFDELFISGDPQLGTELGRRAARVDIRFHHSQTMSFNDPLRILEQCARLWEQYYSEGRMEVEDRGDRRVKVVLVNPGVHRLICGQTVPAWGAEAITLAGAKDARAEQVVCIHQGFSRCEYVVEWG
jgi:hypothetical protein